MEAGVNGLNGLNAQQLVVKPSSRVTVPALHPNQRMVEMSARAVYQRQYPVDLRPVSILTLMDQSRFDQLP